MAYFEILSENNDFLRKTMVCFPCLTLLQREILSMKTKQQEDIMKKIIILALCLALAASLCACGCTNDSPATTPSANTTPSTQNDNMPTDTMTIPVPETNIPDTSVDDTMPGGITDGTNGVTGRSSFPMNGIQ